MRKLLIQRTFLLLLLIFILFFSYTGELVAYNNGLGWDGETYYAIIRDFDKLLLSNGIDRYHMTRFLPFAVLHYSLTLLGITISVENAIFAARLMNFMLLMILVFYFYKISTFLKWNPETELIAFSFCFFNIYVLKISGYYPILSDSAALTLSYAAIYYYFTRNYIAEFLIGLLSIVTWPILCIVIILLVAFPRDSVCKIDRNKFNICISTFIRIFYMFFSLVVLIYFSLRTYYANPGISIDLLLYQFKGNVNIGITIVATAIVPVFFYYFTSVLKVDWKEILRSTFEKRHIAWVFGGFSLFFFAYAGLSKLGGESNFSIGYHIVALGIFPTTDILVFLETHFLYLGIFFLLIVLCWKDIVGVIKNQYGIGYFFVMMFMMIWVLDIETRKLISFYPVMLIPLMTVLQKKKLKWSVAFIIMIFCLVSSFFWYQINTPEILDAFKQDYRTYYKYPAQRYYQFLGPWQCHEVYWITMYFEVVLGLIIVTLYRKGLLTKNE